MHRYANVVPCSRDTIAAIHQKSTSNAPAASVAAVLRMNQPETRGGFTR